MLLHPQRTAPAIRPRAGRSTDSHVRNPLAARAAVVAAHRERAAQIAERLNEFNAVPSSEWFYELCFCLCTPQSKAIHAAKVVEKLKALDFWKHGADPTELLSNPEHYIRFHNVKAKNLLQLRTQYGDIQRSLLETHDSVALRATLVHQVRGMGMKEASHFLRNIGHRELAIIDRHVLKHLYRCGVIDDMRHPSTVRRYEEIEQQWKHFASDIRIPIDELDLVFWSMETSFILK